jgi:Thioredoxin
MPIFTPLKKEKNMDTGRKVESSYIKKAMRYETYTKLISDLLTAGRTTGPDQSEAMIHYTELNQQRMHRVEKSILVLPSAEALIRSINLPQTWLVLTEAWCGDAAHSIPIMHALAALNPLIDLRLLLRDENPELMDRYLTNGVSRSIPKLIGLDTTTLEELFTWGPRPAPLQEVFLQMKGQGTEFHAIKEELQRWYNKDKTVAVQQELATLAAGAVRVDMGLTA